MADDENIEVFQSITGADEETAANCLEAFEGNLDRAVSHFLDAGAGAHAPKPRQKPERSGAARVNGSRVNRQSEIDAAVERKAYAVKQRATIEARETEQRHNQGDAEEDAALQQALAASNMASGKSKCSPWLDHWARWPPPA